MDDVKCHDGLNIIEDQILCESSIHVESNPSSIDPKSLVKPLLKNVGTELLLIEKIGKMLSNVLIFKLKTWQIFTDISNIDQ